MTQALDPVQLAARTLRDAVRDKSYRAYPMGQEAGAYLRWKRGSITAATYKSYESTLDKLVRFFCDLEMSDFEPPMGTERMEEFLDTRCAELTDATYNTYHAICADFFKWAAIKGKLHGNPMLPVRKRKKRGVYRAIFSADQRRAILGLGPDPDYLRRDRICLRLLLDHGIRKGALRNIQFQHFDTNRRRLTIFTKGGKVQELALPDPKLWDDLEKLMFEIGARPSHYLIASRRRLFWKYDPDTGDALMRWHNYPEKQFSERGTHEWWYGCLQRADVAEPGQTSGHKMHRARHTVGQRILDKTGNLKAVQKQLGHSSIRTTGDMYVDWDIQQQEDTMLLILSEDDE